MTRILVIDDDPQERGSLEAQLRTRRYTVTTAADSPGALDQLAREPADAIILGLDLHGLDELESIQALRTLTSSPVIVLSSQGGDTEKVAALDSGADDYLTKPYSMNELLARIRAVLRRPAAEQSAGDTFVIGDYLIDTERCAVYPNEDRGPGSGEQHVVRLTPTEWRILTELLHHSGQLVTARHLLYSAWGPGHEGKTNYLRVYLAGLRRKLEQDPTRPRHLLTVPGMGYRFEP